MDFKKRSKRAYRAFIRFIYPVRTLAVFALIVSLLCFFMTIISMSYQDGTEDIEIELTIPTVDADESNRTPPETYPSNHESRTQYNPDFVGELE